MAFSLPFDPDVRPVRRIKSTGSAKHEALWARAELLTSQSPVHQSFLDSILTNRSTLNQLSPAPISPSPERLLDQAERTWQDADDTTTCCRLLEQAEALFGSPQTPPTRSHCLNPGCVHHTRVLTQKVEELEIALEQQRREHQRALSSHQATIQRLASELDLATIRANSPAGSSTHSPAAPLLTSGLGASPAGVAVFTAEPPDELLMLYFRAWDVETSWSSKDRHVSRRWMAREGDIVWVRCNSVAPESPAGAAVQTHFWPGIVLEKQGAGACVISYLGGQDASKYTVMQSSGRLRAFEPSRSHHRMLALMGTGQRFKSCWRAAVRAVQAKRQAPKAARRTLLRRQPKKTESSTPIAKTVVKTPVLANRDPNPQVTERAQESAVKSTRKLHNPRRIVVSLEDELCNGLKEIKMSH